MSSRYEEQLARQMEITGIPTPERQYRFAEPHRQYRVDFAWPSRGLVVEVDGGAFVGRGGRGAVVSRTTPVGHHQTVEDYRKRNLLNLLGWRVLSYQPEQIGRGEALREIELALRFDLQHPIQMDEGMVAHVRELAQVDRVKRVVRERRAAQRKAVRERGARWTR